MKPVNRLTMVIIVGVCFTTALPILAAILLARHQAAEREEGYVAGLAHIALARSETTADQLVLGSRRINGMSLREACSENGLDLMRRIDLSSTLIQAVGYVDGNVMRCSSIGGGKAFDLGPPDIRSSTGGIIRTDVRLLDPGISYLAIQSGAFVGIVHKDLALSFVDEVPGLTLDVFSWTNRRTLISRGKAGAGQVGHDMTGNAIFHRGGRIVAVVRSARYDLGAVATLPAAQTSTLDSQSARVLIPVGIIAGLLLSALLVRVLRMRASMPALIRGGLKAGEFHLSYQPIVDLATGRTIGAEALLRWQRTGGEIMPPELFIPAAEQTGIISLITDHVLDLLSADAYHLLRLAPRFHFAVNFAVADVQRPDFIEVIQRFFARSGLDAGNLVVEITERCFVDVAQVGERIRRLRSTGTRVAIDDFGTGYSSLGVLAQLEIDYLKIDKLFVHSLGTDSATSQVAARIIEMARDLKLQIVAEGVETQQQQDLLKDLDVDLAQGYFYGKPMSVDDLLQRMRAERSGHLAKTGLASHP